MKTEQFMEAQHQDEELTTLFTDAKKNPNRKGCGQRWRIRRLLFVPQLLPTSLCRIMAYKKI